MILDHKENLVLSDEVAKQYEYATEALTRLADGLFWIDEDVKRVEKYTLSRARKENIQIASAGGILENTPLGRLSCQFQWYAVSAYNYAQLVGWLIYGDTVQAKAYVNRVMPNISKYRNKVAAHFALTDPRKDDNVATLTASVMTYIVYAKGHFYAGSVSPKTIDAKEIEQSKIPAWSLTIAHKQLSERFWPRGRTKTYPAIMIPGGESVKIEVNYATGA
jgi:hypothetical protein